jgi:hypothetical protein
MEDEKKSKKVFKGVEKSSRNGLKISYDKEELEEFLPHLIDELYEKKKTLKIDSVELETENNEVVKSLIKHNELTNPGVIDFMRRCTTVEEANEILDFCLKREEIGQNEYKILKSIISKKGGLEKIIKESGGRKTPGYYERKYYKKEFNNQNFKRNNS